MAKQTVCNLCGKIVDERMIECQFSLHTMMAYGSRHDGDLLDIDLCPGCADKVIEELQEKCKIPVLTSVFQEDE